MSDAKAPINVHTMTEVRRALQRIQHEDQELRTRFATGSAATSSGTVVVSDPAILADGEVVATWGEDPGANTAILFVSAITAGVGFTISIRGPAVGDGKHIHWFRYNPTEA